MPLSAKTIMIEDLDFGVTVKGFAPGQRLSPRYSLNRTLGQGGMGVVWLVHDEELKRDIAMKFLPEMVVRDREALTGLKRETNRSLELTHANIVRIYDFIQEAKWAGISMEYVDGDTLSALKIEEPGGCFDVSRIAPWMEQLCLALSYAHEDAQIVHRDLKPTNLMASKAGKLKVTDFGIAGTLTESISRVTMQSSGGGTLVYMSPQQAMGEPPSVADDIYSVGATIYDLLTGKPPFYSGDIITQVREKTPTPLTERRARLNIAGKEPIPPHWEAAVTACLQKDPARRPRSVRELADRFFGESASKPKTITFPTLPNTAAVARTLKSLQSLPSKKWLPAAVAAVAAGVVIAALAYFGGRKPEEEKPAPQPAATASTVAPPVSPAEAPGGPPVAAPALPGATHPSDDIARRPAAPGSAAPSIQPPARPADSDRTVSELESLDQPDLLKRAEAGDAEAQGLAALSYQVGFKFPEDLSLANQWAKKAADAGDPIGEFTLAMLYSSGQGTARNSGAAADLAQKAMPQLAQAEGRRPAAADYCLAVAYRDGLGTPQDLQQALALFEQEAARGSALGQYGAGIMYAQGMGTSPIPAKASEYFQKAANQGLTEAMVSMALAYQNGQGVPKDEQKAGEFWRQAAERGNVPAQVTVAQTYTQAGGAAKDLSKAVELYRKAAGQGVPAAQYKLGWMYARGLGVARDPKKAAEFYLQAADAGYGAAQASLALVYATGEGVRKDAQKAAEFYEKVKNQVASASDSDRVFLQALEKETPAESGDGSASAGDAGAAPGAGAGAPGAGASAPEVVGAIPGLAGATPEVAGAAQGVAGVNEGISIGTLDPSLVGVWRAGGKSTPLSKRVRWQIAKNGQYSDSGPDTDSGAVTGSDGHLRQLSTEGNSWVELAYVVRGKTLMTYGPQGLTEWHKTSGQVSTEKTRVSSTRSHSEPQRSHGIGHGIGHAIKHFFGF
jgi:TPR repeat protein/serine/threonine protein kinase